MSANTINNLRPKLGLALVLLVVFGFFYPLQVFQAQSIDKNAAPAVTPTAGAGTASQFASPDGTQVQVSTDAIKSVAYSKDGKYLVAGYKSGVSFFDPKSLTFIKKIDLSATSNSVDALAFSPNSNLLAAATQDGTNTPIGYFWDLTTWEFLNSITDGSGIITGIDFDASGHKIIIGRDTADANGNTIFNYALDGTNQRSYEAPKVSSLQVDRDANKLYIGGADGHIYVYDWDSANFISRVQFHAANITSLALNPTSKLLLAGDDSGNLFSLDLGASTPFLIKDKSVNFAKGLSVSADGNLIAYCTSDGNMVLSTPDRIEPQQTLYHALNGKICNATTFSEDDSAVTGAFSDGDLRVYSINKSSLPADPYMAGAASVQTPATVPATSISLSKIAKLSLPTLTKKSILASNVDQIVVQENNIQFEDLVYDHQADFAYPILLSGSGNTTWLAKDRNGYERAEIFNDSLVKIKDDNKQVKLTLSGNGSSLNTLVFNPKADELAAGGSDGTIFVWNSLNGEKKCEIFTHPYAVKAIQYSHDGSVLGAAFDDLKIELYAADNCQSIGHLPGGDYTINQLTFSPDDQFIITSAADAAARLYKAPTQESLYKFEPDDSTVRVFTAAYNPDQPLVAAGADNGDLYVWNVNTRDFLKHLTVGSKNNPITSLQFSKDGSQIFACQKDQTCAVVGLPK